MRVCERKTGALGYGACNVKTYCSVSRRPEPLRLSGGVTRLYSSEGPYNTGFSFFVLLPKLAFLDGVREALMSTEKASKSTTEEL
jgi:hypothetical protein